MDFHSLTGHLEQAVRVIADLAGDIPDQQARWRPDPGSWSILEVVNHLYDEEREDFRVRLDILLHRPGDPWPPIDPQGWVVERKYNDRDLAASLGNFLAEREKSLAWLRSLDAPDLNRFVESRFGKMAAGDMLAAWAAHDLLHIRQLMELRYLYLRSRVAPFSPEYAGDF